MSRKSRYNNSASPNIAWNCAAYIRISKEDVGHDCSIDSQKQIIDQYCIKNNLYIKDYYIDNGFSGASLNRPRFNSLLNSIDNSVINCIIVKDLSRLSRNNEEINNLINKIIIHQIRLIAISDNIDSYINPGSITDLAFNFKNIINDQYLYDISQKIKSARHIAYLHGDYIASIAPYGYKKDPMNKKKLIVDENVKDVVSTIYKKFLEVENYNHVVHYLNHEHILSPYEYFQQQNIKLVINKRIRGWSGVTVKRILTNDVYLGNATQNKTRSISYKNSKRINCDPSEIITVENTHEPIIDKETFDLVQSIISKKYQIHNAPNKSIFSGKIFCKTCGASMTATEYKGENKHRAYYCKYCKNKSSRISIKILTNIVLETLNKYINVYCDVLDLLKKYNKKADIYTKSNTDKIKQLTDQKSDLYIKLKNNIITKNEYLDKKQSIEKSILYLQEQINITDKNVDCPLLERLSKYGHLNSLSDEIVSCFIDQIVISTKTEIDLHFSFKDEFDNLVEILDYNDTSGMDDINKKLNNIYYGTT